MRYLCLDVGSKTIGLATGEMIAREYNTLRAKDKNNFYSEKGAKQAAEQLKEIIEKEEIEALVIGLPVDDEGQETEESQKIRQFAKRITKQLNIQVHFVNETLTTFMAEDILEGQNLSPRQVKERSDQLAACLILQQFFEENAVF